MANKKRFFLQKKKKLFKKTFFWTRVSFLIKSLTFVKRCTTLEISKETGNWIYEACQWKSDWIITHVNIVVVHFFREKWVLSLCKKKIHWSIFHFCFKTNGINPKTWPVLPTLPFYFQELMIMMPQKELIGYCSATIKSPFSLLKNSVEIRNSGTLIDAAFLVPDF